MTARPRKAAKTSRPIPALGQLAGWLAVGAASVATPGSVEAASDAGAADSGEIRSVSEPASSASVSAVAGAPPSASVRMGPDDSRREARRLFEEARSKHQEGREAEAVALLERADDIAPNPDVIVLGAAWAEGAGDVVRACRLFRKLLSAHSGTLDQATKARVSAHLEDLNKLVGYVMVDTGAEHERVWIDGEDVGTTPFRWPIAVSPGMHWIRVQRSGHRQRSTRVEIHAGDTARTVVPDVEDIPLGGVQEQVPPIRRLCGCAAGTNPGSASLLTAGVAVMALARRRRRR